MYNVIIYEDEKGKSELNDMLLDMAQKGVTNKDLRIQFKQITYYIELLKNNGTNLGINITKHLEGEIWELRPGDNRVLYFFFQNDTYVLLHMFKKKTKKTPRAEIDKAHKEAKDYMLRNGGTM